MRQSKIISILKGDKIIVLYNEKVKQRDDGELVYEGGQWIGHADAMYSRDGAPRIETREQFMTLYDISTKKGSEYYFDLRTYPSLVDMEDFSDTDEMAEKLDTRFTVGDKLQLSAFRGENETILFVNDRYLAPFQKKDEGGVEYIIRGNDRGKYLVIRQEMQLAAIILPVKLTNDTRSINLADELGIIRHEVQSQINAAERK